MLNSFHISVIGDRHIQENMPCQDYAITVCEKDVAIAIVCDGHGGKPFFRSDVGAKMAAASAVEGIRDFISTVDKTPFAGKNSEEMEETEVTKIFSALFSKILKLWLEKIRQHIAENPFAESEMQCVPEGYRYLFKNTIMMDSAYGTTLLAYAQCKDYWFAFQIGDGTIMLFNNDACSLPIPADESCHDNITTSMCDPNALDEFRYYIDGSGTFPSAAFVCTDGMEKCFRTEEALGGYLYNVSQVLRLGGSEVLQEKMENLLPKFSHLTSGDDISIACICNNAE